MSLRAAGRAACAVLAAATGVAAVAATADAAAPWVPGPVYGNGTVSFDGDVAVSPDGGATVVWTELSQWGADGRSTGYAQRTPAGGPPAPAVPVSPPNAHSVATAVAATAGGTTIALAVDWNDPDDDGDDAIRLTTIATDGSVSRSDVVADAVDRLHDEGTELAVDPAGNALVTWISGPAGGRRLFARRVSAGGTPGPVLELEHVTGTATPQVAFAPDGTARVVWIGSGLGRQLTVARLNTAGEQAGTLQRLSAAGVPTVAPRLSASTAGVAVSWVQGAASERELRVARLPSAGPLTDAGQLIASDAVSDVIDVATSILLADDGSLTATWPTRAPDSGISSFPLQTRTVDPDGRLGPIASLSDDPPADVTEACPELVETDSGSRYALWLRVGFGPDGGVELRGREISPDGTPAAATVVWSAAGSEGRRPFSADADALGNLVVGWLTASPDAPGASYATATLTRRTPPAVVLPPVVAPPTGDAPPVAPAPGPAAGPLGRSVTPKAAAGLRIGTPIRRGARVTVRGRLDRRASGRVTVAWAQRIGRKNVKRSVRARIVRGRFTARLRLPRALATARTRATVTVSYAGDADTRAAVVRRRAPRSTARRATTKRAVKRASEPGSPAPRGRTGFLAPDRR